MRKRKKQFKDGLQPSLFSAKEEYLASHDARGVRYDMARLSATERRKRQVDNLHLLEGMPIKDGLPALQPYNGTTEFEMVSYKERKKPVAAAKAVHFFMDDFQFLHIVWYKLEATTRNLMNYCDIVFAPDFSLYVDALEVMNQYNIFRSRFVASYWQRCGFSVIPTASWGGADTFSYCFRGLPEHSVIAVCGIGHKHCPCANSLWHMAIRELEEQKTPTAIIIYGGEKPDEMELHTPVIHVEDYITRRFRR